MTAFRAALLASVTLVLSVGGIAAQTPAAPATNAPASSGLPSGLVRQGNVIMMAPISDSDANGPPELQIIRSLEPHMDAYLRTASCNKMKGLGWCRKCAKCVRPAHTSWAW